MRQKWLESGTLYIFMALVVVIMMIKKETPFFRIDDMNEMFNKTFIPFCTSVGISCKDWYSSLQEGVLEEVYPVTCTTVD